MSNIRINLDNNWKITGFGAKGHQIGPLAANVPGHVHNDLLNHGFIPDPLWRDQAIECQWVEAYDWVYEAEFQWSTEGDTDSVVIHFEGLDTLATLYLNNQWVGSSQNMFIHHAFHIGRQLKPGNNQLRVHFTSVQTYLRYKDVTKYASLFSEDRVFLRRMQCTFGWDWVHRLVSYGIWRPVYIESKPTGEIKDIFVRTVTAEQEMAILEWKIEVDSKGDEFLLRLELTDPYGNMVWNNDFSSNEVKISGSLSVSHPRLWWPAGYGPPDLYQFRALLCTTNGTVSDEKTIEYGIRTVVIEQIPDEIGTSFTIVINGHRIFAKGGNWVPADPFPSCISLEKYEHLLQALVNGHMNMLRVWGGGTYERPEFWHTCNRLGIMVSQDFLMACAEYPQTEAWFLTEMREEITAAIKELRNHPSLIFWCGDNELAMNNNPEDDYFGKEVFARVTGPLCREMDPGRPIFPTSPMGGRPFNSQTEGDCHVSTWYDPQFILGDMQDYRARISRGLGRFVSECAIPGSPPLTSLLKMMTMEDVLDKTGAMWEFRTRDNPYNGQDELTHYRMLEKTAVNLFGEFADPRLQINALEYVHYEFVRLEAEHYRRRKYQSSGILYWMYNDCWPASGWALIDYYGYPKAGYYGAKKAFKPLMISIEDRGTDVAVWMVNDTLFDVNGQVEVNRVTTDGSNFLQLCDDTVSIPRNSATMVKILEKNQQEVSITDPHVVLQAIWRSKDCVDTTVYIDVLPKYLVLSKTELKVSCQRLDAFSGFISISSEVFARVVTIVGDLIPDDNYFDLLPGEQRIIAYRTKDNSSWDGNPQVSCWNQM